MNGGPSSSAAIISGNGTESSSVDSLLVPRGGPSSSTWFNTNTTFGNTNWIQPTRLTPEQLANTYSSPTINYSGLRDPWGLSNSSVIDDNERIVNETSSENIASDVVSVGEDARTLETAVESTSEIAEAAEVASSSTPWGIAAIINQQLGSAVASAQTSALSAQQNTDFANNMQQHGINVQLNADIIKSQQSNTILRQDTGGSLGSFLGPIGAIIGQAIAGYNSVNQLQLDTAASFGGWVNPQQSNIVASQTTAGDAGVMTQQDNVDTTNA